MDIEIEKALSERNLKAFKELVEGVFETKLPPRIGGKITLQAVSSARGIYFSPRISRPERDSAFLLWIKNGAAVYYLSFDFTHRAANQMRRIFLHWKEDPTIMDIKKFHALKFEVVFEFDCE